MPTEVTICLRLRQTINYYWHDKLKLNYVWCVFFQQILPKSLVDFFGITEVYEP